MKSRTIWAGAGAVIALWALGIRVHNAFHYPLHFGFDAPANWNYIAGLLESWRLPAPGEGWSTSHPPFFYYASALLGRAMDGADKRSLTVAIRLVSSLLGLVGIALAVAWVRHEDPENRPRTFIAAALLLFLPVHIYMSAMLGEEILLSSLIAAVLVGVSFDLQRAAERRFPLPVVAGLGLLAGLAFLTKLTGLLVVIAVGIAYTVDAIRRHDVRRAVPRILIFGIVAIVVGGWPYIRNKVEYGFYYPQNLMVHRLMFTMPPGERGVEDYLNFPLATFLDPQVLDTELLHSVWGSTYTTLWFDGHRVMLPRSQPEVERMGSWLLLLGLVPTMAFVVGLWRGLRRAIRRPGGPDTLFLAIVALTLAGYILFTWQNPWYATLKASYMLGIMVPFAYYSSEVLVGWLQLGSGSIGLRQIAVALPLAFLLTASGLTFTVDLLFQKRESPGFIWPRVDPSRHYSEAQKAARNRLENPVRKGLPR